MKMTGYKYCMVILMLGIFLARGLATVVPVISLFINTHVGQELVMTAEEEKTDERTTEKSLTEKEFFAEAICDHIPAQYILLPLQTQPLRDQQFQTGASLPVTTPPPEFIG